MGHFAKDQHSTKQCDSQCGIQPGDFFEKMNFPKQIRYQ